MIIRRSEEKNGLWRSTVNPSAYKKIPFCNALNEDSKKTKTKGDSLEAIGWPQNIFKRICLFKKRFSATGEAGFYILSLCLCQCPYLGSNLVFLNLYTSVLKSKREREIIFSFRSYIYLKERSGEELTREVRARYRSFPSDCLGVYADFSVNCNYESKNKKLI